jgi:hypothetical protein
MHDDHCKSPGRDPLHPSYITFGDALHR